MSRTSWRMINMPMHPVNRALLIVIGIAACMLVFWLEGHL